ncbi:DUF1826 domain-containing protein [Marinomonas mediterranea]|uniref:DUF1826 domain-containing protein n=1 Tax=Marinomonas mediterranea TaxID=119864 RepID=UPI00234B09A4|nr:DUF1826 domain-containing protein [Marinomonas mediterranea]WCN07927.1 DUF1826 domain-containing protein [Marinomonas mediterranea]WCN12022.1 DUF1826 domain-containing protein [Marinomonas mediterranea]
MSLIAQLLNEKALPEIVPSQSSRLVNELVDIAQIYEDELNFVAWERTLEPSLINAVETLVSILSERPKLLSHSETVSVENVETTLQRVFPECEGRDLIIEDIRLLLEAFCCLFELEQVGLRISLVKRAMCPRFHVDQVPCRLITTYCGPATQWLENSDISRAKLGRGNGGLPDEHSGLVSKDATVFQLKAGDVGLLKGEKWYENEGRGIVHRSPEVQANEGRLILTFDFA